MRYYLYGHTPVKLETTTSGSLKVLVFNPKTRSFYPDCTLYPAILFGRGDEIRQIDEAEFRQLTA
ncbi:hypothetical protein [Deinococcus cellulosilyticus]|uniref:Uncharacterized protein n=1 Tax=Deinococcus cellulosilyticus (strain DSM 18568 / NBRC 106333 / KACC 11606 / 5516J-15) TaxID=1223518 RepID=A0A511N4D3_DEIC1|nr:hypothetical protein [Deinococcus cellulosilyticus]GEM47327.1 hypothetical protein DC3_29620 [Deinococcus cellulosilyticus NBRC 106333 = KACC 11606]